MANYQKVFGILPVGLSGTHKSESRSTTTAVCCMTILMEETIIEVQSLVSENQFPLLHEFTITLFFLYLPHFLGLFFFLLA